MIDGARTAPWSSTTRPCRRPRGGGRREAVVARGGRGGRGNVRFAGPKNRVPQHRRARGRKARSGASQIELRTVADLGLVGLPNAGKSTLLPRLTAGEAEDRRLPVHHAHPEPGRRGGGRRAVRRRRHPRAGRGRAPREGARPSVPPPRHPLPRARARRGPLAARSRRATSDTLRDELAAYDPSLAERASVVVGTKSDLVDEPTAARADAIRALPVSAVTRRGHRGARGAAGRARRAGRRPQQPPRAPTSCSARAGPVHRVARGRWLAGQRPNVERWVRETDLDDERQIERLQRRLIKEGVERQLTKAGARRGDEIRIADRVFEFLPETTSRVDRRERGRLSMDVAGLLADEERGWMELTEVFGDIPPSGSTSRSVTAEGWSPKDVMYHVAAWAEEAATVLGRIAAGTHRASDPDTQAAQRGVVRAGRGLEDGRRSAPLRERHASRCGRRSCGSPRSTPLRWSGSRNPGPATTRSICPICAPSSERRHRRP